MLFRKDVRIHWNNIVTSRSVFEGMCQLYDYATFDGYLGLGSYIGTGSCIRGKVGRFTSIADHVYCNSGIHPYKAPYATTSPAFYSLNHGKAQCGATFATKQCFKEERFADEENRYVVEIGNDVWIGEGVFLAGGVHIGNGAIVLAHACVLNDVEPYAIVGGLPAKVIGYRYDKDTINWLLKIKWWNNNFEWFKDNWQLLNDIEKLKKYYLSE